MLVKLVYKNYIIHRACSIVVVNLLEKIKYLVF